MVYEEQMERNIEVYVEDMITPSPHHLSIIVLTLLRFFEKIRYYNIRLNLEKCAFKLQGGIIP